MDKTTKKEKPIPKRCVCGLAAAIVNQRGKKMVTCPNPERCQGNLRTMWHGHELSAIAEWDSLVDSYQWRDGGHQG